MNSADQNTDRLLFHLWLLTKHFNGLLSSCQEGECDLSVQEMKAIEFLGRLGASKMRDLADYLKLAVSSTTALVDNLEAKNAVKRERSRKDRRVIMLELTEEGRRDYQTAMDTYRGFCQQILGQLKSEEQSNLLELFDKIYKAYGK